MNNFSQEDIELVYDTEIRKARKENIEKVFNEKETAEKVHNFAERFSCDEMLVWKRMHDDMAFALTFAKDPAKQSIHQHVAARYIKKFPFVSNFVELPASGKGAKYCINGKIISGSKIKSKDVKSIDFYWEYIYKNKKLCFYATHKHTDDDGGAQDNQYNDVVSFHENAKKCEDKNIVLLSITDGNYYKVKSTRDLSFNGSRLEYFSKKCCGKRSCATTSNGIPRKTIPYIIEWLNNNFKDNSSDLAAERTRLASIYNESLED